MSDSEEAELINNCKLINEELSSNEDGEIGNSNSSTKETEASSDFYSSSSENFEESSKDEGCISKRNKVEEEPKSIPFAQSFGSKAIFGSAAKSIVSFNSIGGSSSLPSKNLFAEDTIETSISAEAKESGQTDYEIITGEEDEITIISIKGKLFEFNSETKDWHERGVGMFKLNKSKNTKKHRIIMRTDGVQKLILNSNIFPKIICEIVQEKNIRFSANNFESKIQTFILRTKNVDDATALDKSLKEAINSTKTTEENF